MLNKMNTFTDFIDSAQFLVAQRYGDPDRLVANGRSAGGMVMGVVTNMRPDLFRAVVAEVPVLDVLNLFLDPGRLTAEYNFGELGDPRVEDQFTYIRSWDPYYNLEARDYPNILVTAGFNDPRLPFWVSAKWVAKLRTLKMDSSTLLLKTNMAGHMGASGRYDSLKELAFKYAFILDTVGA